KALRKDRNERYQIVKELAIDLRSLRRELEVNSMLERSIIPATGASEYARASIRDRKVETNELKQARTTIHKPVGNRAWIGFAALAPIVLGFAAFGFYKMKARTETKLRVPFEHVEVTKLTTNGNALMGALSPDG